MRNNSRPIRIFCRRALKGEVCITRSDFSQSRLSQSGVSATGEPGGQKRILTLKIQPLYSYPPTFQTHNSWKVITNLNENEQIVKIKKNVQNYLFQQFKIYPCADISTYTDRLINQNK